MPDAPRIIRQWLETEAAFGVADVPVKRRPKSAPAPKLSAPPITRSPDRQIPQSPTRPPNTQYPTPTSPARPAPPPQFAVRQASTPRPKTIIVMPPAPAGNIADLPALTRAQKHDLLEKLRQKTLADSAPFLNEISTKLVFGEGDPDAALMFIGEGPGIEEDKTGRPFVGRSGQLLDKMIAAMGYKRDPTGGGGTVGIYIANVVKLRAAEPDPTNNNRLKDRPPTPEEAARALPVLHEQIAIIRPRVIVTLGAPAIKHLTGTTEGVMKIRGTWLSFRGIPVMPTYHPSFLLRAYTEENRRKVWNDLKLAVGKAKP